MLKRLLLLPAFFIAFAAQAQTPTLEVVSATPASGTANVAADEPVNISFTFNEPIPDADYVLDLVTVSATIMIDDMTLSADRKTVTLEVTHEADTDYLWILSGSFFIDEECDPELGQVGEFVEMRRPFVLHYTTSAAAGSYTVSGTASIAGAGKTGVSVKPINVMGLRSLSAGQTEAQTMSAAPATHAQSISSPAVLTTARQRAANAARAAELDGSIVLLIDAHNPNPDVEGGAVFGAAVVESDGSYQVRYVRPGAYYAIAISDLNIELDLLSTIFNVYEGFVVGAHDSNDVGDDPDVIAITTGSADNINIAMRPASAYAVNSAEAEAGAKALVTALTEESATTLGINSFVADWNGNSAFWTVDLMFPGEAGDLQATVTRQAFLTYVEAAPEDYEGAQPLPDGYKTSTEVLAAVRAHGEVNAFLGENTSAMKWAMLFSGETYLMLDPVSYVEPDKNLWRVVIMVMDTEADLFGGRAVTAYVDMETGEVGNVQIYPAGPFTYAETAGAAAAALYGASPARLYNVYGTTVNPADGTSIAWTYSYTTDGDNTFVSVPMTASFLSFWFPFPFPWMDKPATVPAIPEDPFPLTEALEIADFKVGSEVRAKHGNNYSISVEGGYARNLILDREDILDVEPQLATTPVWVITYEAFNYDAELCTPSSESAVVILNMETGAFIREIGYGITLPNEEPGHDVVFEAELGAGFPNPFSAETVIPFALPGAQHATLKVYDVLGREVATLLDEVVPAGEQSARWNAGGLASGVYFVRLTTDGTTLTQKVVLQR